VVDHTRPSAERRDQRMCARSCDTLRMGAPSIEDIARVLLRDWDPLAVIDSDEAPEHEYLFEAGELRAMHARGATVETIAEYLESRRLGASNRSRDRATADALWDLGE
jgi:hypothetical protein